MMVLSRRFAKELTSKLPSVEELTDAEKEEMGRTTCLGGICSRPTSRPLTGFSRGSVDSKTLRRSSSVRGLQISDEGGGEEEEEEAGAIFRFAPKFGENEEEWDTDLDIEEIKDPYDPTGRINYLEACKIYGVIPISYFVRHMTDTNLTMRHHGLGPKGTKALAVPLISNTSIISLNLSDNWMEAEGTAAIADMLKENCYIVDLDLSENNIGNEGAEAVSMMLLENTSLVKLNLSGNKLHDHMVEHLSRILINSHTIKFLDLSHNVLGDRAGEILGPAIAENTGIKELNLSWNAFRGKGAVHIAKGMGANIFLQVLDLSYNGFGNEGAAILGEALKINNVLEELNISNNRITVVGALRFSLGLQANKTLRVLSMARNPMQNSGCFVVLKSIHANVNSAIECLDFSDISVDEAFGQMYETMKSLNPLFSVKHKGNSPVSSVDKRKCSVADPAHDKASL
ncbi:leucine-rich repeat-containing protein 74B isoform X1 [Microcaecilia unicolor]|uniref:Leucine-rich repeat-containing protein 74B isoform X1 n=1 Tax=Microcaecilia unicolor TaxID=1415580 RepID=A0A6P7Z7R9_9AMPH|nr:leucine-rich repeat-containing protein 74B isoform X1 [Microcaecilia unicolor]